MAAWGLETIWTPNSSSWVYFFLGLVLVMVVVGLCFGFVIILKEILLSQSSFALPILVCIQLRGR